MLSTGEDLTERSNEKALFTLATIFAFQLEEFGLCVIMSWGFVTDKNELGSGIFAHLFGSREFRVDPSLSTAFLALIGVLDPDRPAPYTLVGGEA